MPLTIPLIALGAGWLLTRPGGAADVGSASDIDTTDNNDTIDSGVGGAVDMPVNAQSWDDLLLESAGDLDVDFLRRWITRESGWNPCSIGSTAQLVRDGYAREAGLFQLYFESPLDRQFGVTSGELRVACSATSQSALRELSDDERRLHIESGVAMAQQYVAQAHQRLRSAGLEWTEPEVYALAKLNHGLPAIPKSLLPRAASENQATDWQAFKDYCLGLDGTDIGAIDRGIVPYLPISRFFSNAEYVGGITA